MPILGWKILKFLEKEIVQVLNPMEMLTISILKEGGVILKMYKIFLQNAYLKWSKA